MFSLLCSAVTLMTRSHNQLQTVFRTIRKKKLFIVSIISYYPLTSFTRMSQQIHVLVETDSMFKEVEMVFKALQNADQFVATSLA